MSRRIGSVFLSVAVWVCVCGPVAAQVNEQTATIVVGGYSGDGWSEAGVFGIDVQDDIVDDIAAAVGLPYMGVPGGLDEPNVVTMAEFYGDTPPVYYTAADIAELDAVTAQWGGGLPRYALIQAKFIRHVLERTGAEQVNVVGASLGAAISRYMLEADVEDLMSEGRIARWITLEGVTCGSWVASQDGIVDILEFFGPVGPEAAHMHYDWFDANLHDPRIELDNPLFDRVRISHQVSTLDDLNEQALTTALLLLEGTWKPNDGVGLVEDQFLHSVTEASKWRGRGPATTFFDANHDTIRDHGGAYAYIGASILGSRRATATLRRIRLANLSETVWPIDQGPAEFLLESRVFAPWAESAWGATDSVSALVRASGVPPLVPVAAKNQWVDVADWILHDEMVTDGEVDLRFELQGWELDWDAAYGVWEWPGGTGAQDLGGAATLLPLEDGVYLVSASGWDAEIEIEVQRYPVGMTLSWAGSGDPSSAAASVSGEAAPLDIAAGPNQAGQPYLVLGSLSGTTPGTPLPGGGLLALNWDDYTLFVLMTLDQPMHQAFFGLLDEAGRAAATFNAGAAPMPSSVIGLEAHYAGLYATDTGAIQATNAVALALTP